MSLDVTLQMPYVLFSILIKALLRFLINFACLSASLIFSSFESVVDPSSNALKEGEVSSVPLSESLAVAARSIRKSSWALSILARIICLNSFNSASEYVVFSGISIVKTGRDVEKWETVFQRKF